MSSVGERPFGMVLQVNSLIEVFFSGGGCLRRVTGPRKEVVVVKIVVGMIRREILTNLGVLVEVVILAL